MFYLIFTHFVVWPETSRNLRSGFDFHPASSRLASTVLLWLHLKNAVEISWGSPSHKRHKSSNQAIMGWSLFSELVIYSFFSEKGANIFKGFPREPRLNHQPFEPPIVSYLELTDCWYQPLVLVPDRGTTSSFRRSLVSRCFSLGLHPSPLSSTFNAVVWDGLFIGIACRVLWDGSSDLKVFANREELDWWGWWGWWVEVPHKQTWNLQIIWLKSTYIWGFHVRSFKCVDGISNFLTIDKCQAW